MTPWTSVAWPSVTAVGTELLDSDRRYFESGATVEQLGGATLAHVPGFERVSAGCVVHRVDPAVLPRDPERWLDLVERRLAALRCRSARLYLEGHHPGLEATLLARGYRPQEEIGFALLADGRAAAGKPDGPVVELRAVTTPDDWAAKVALHRLSGGIDGHEPDPEEWVALERLRVTAGYMRPFFIVCRGAICGVVGLAGGGSLLRLKNLLLHPSWRRMGIGTAVLHRAHGIAWREGWTALGVFALAGYPGEQLYRRVGYEEATRQTEWVRPLGARTEIVETTA